MKVALLTDVSRVSPVFESTTTGLNIDATANDCKISSTHHFQAKNELDMVNELMQNNIEMVICGAIPFYLEKTIINLGCEVTAFIAGEVDQVVKALHLNQLDKREFKMPGCQRRKKRGNNPLCKHTVNQ